MKSYGNTGQAVTRENDPKFEGFATTSGRDVVSDVARAHEVRSPIHLAPLTEAEERAPVAASRPSGKAKPARQQPQPAGRSPKVTTSVPTTAPAAGAGVCSHAQLMSWAAQHRSVAIRKQGERLETAVRVLIESRRAEQAKEQEKARIAAERQATVEHLKELRKQIKEAEAKLRAARAGRGETTARIRAWALEHGIAVGTHGRIPTDVVDKYRAAHATEQDDA